MSLRVNLFRQALLPLATVLSLFVGCSTSTTPTVGSLTVVRPGAGDSIISGTQSYQIVWTGTGLAKHKNLDYSLDAGVSWKLIGSMDSDLTSYWWNVPDTGSMNAVVRVTDNNGITGKSGVFSIKLVRPAKPQYTLTPIASDLAGIGKLDPNLKNPWGVSFDATQTLLVVGVNHSSTATFYDSLGNLAGVSLPIPSPSSTSSGGAPSGVVQTSVFTIPNRGLSAFVFVGEDGIVSAWGNAMGISPAFVVADRHLTSVFKGAAVQGNFLYVANFYAGTIDVFDKNFNFKASFPDNFGSLGYAPFNIASIDGKLYVASARPKRPAADGSVDDSAGAGIGDVAVYIADNTTGALTYSSTFASGGTLNSPWAIIKAPGSFGQYANDILVGNFGDGRINVFDGTGKSLGQLNDASNAPITIPGLWGLVVPPSGNAGKIYFTAGTNKEADGTIGFIQLKQ